MKRQTVFAIIIVIGIVAIVATLIFGSARTAVLSDIQVQKPDVVVHGTNLGKVEIWEVPTGTGITEDMFQVMANAVLKSTGANGAQTWSAPIPQEPFLSTEIFAKAYDRKGGLVGKVSLSYIGATALYEALWKVSSTNPTSTEPNPTNGEPSPAGANMTLTAGDTETFQNISVTYNSFVSDSRCPIDVQCIWAGNFTANITLKNNEKEITRDVASGVAPFLFGGYAISIIDVQPPKESKLEIPRNAYQVTLHVESV